MLHVAFAVVLMTATPSPSDAASIQRNFFAIDDAVYHERDQAQGMRVTSKGAPAKLLRSAIIVMRRRRSNQFTRRASSPDRRVDYR
jgi:hypothetical protein